MAAGRRPAHRRTDPVDSAATPGETAARAVREHGIGHTVVRSSVGAELRPGAGDSDGLARVEEALEADAVVGTSEGFSGGFVPGQPCTVLTTTPMTLAAWVHEHLRPLLAA